MFSVYAPDKQSVQVDIRPLLALPPVVQLALFDIFQHRLGGRVLGDDVEEQGAPADHDLVLAEMLGELELCFGSGGASCQRDVFVHKEKLQTKAACLELGDSRRWHACRP